jgi:hypothetical protein
MHMHDLAHDHTKQALDVQASLIRSLEFCGARKAWQNEKANQKQCLALIRLRHSSFAPCLFSSRLLLASAVLKVLGKDFADRGEGGHEGLHLVIQGERDGCFRACVGYMRSSFCLGVLHPLCCSRPITVI